MKIIKNYRPNLKALKSVDENDIITEYVNCQVIWSVYKILFIDDAVDELEKLKLSLWTIIKMKLYKWHKLVK